MSFPTPMRRPREDGEVPEEIRELPPDQVIDWLEDNGDGLSEGQLQAITLWLDTRAVGAQVESPEAADAWREAQEVANNLSDTGTAADDEERETDESAAPTVDEYIAEYLDTHGSLPSRGDLMQVAQRSGAANPTAVVDDAIERYAEEQDDGEEGEGDPAGQAFRDITLPEWALQQILNDTGAPVTPDMEQRIVEYFNLYHNGEFESIEDVAPLLSDPTRANQILVQAAVLDDVPDQGWTVPLPGGGKIPIDSRLATNLFENYGFDMSGLTRMARLVGMSGKDALPYDDPTDNLLLVASVMSALNWTDELTGAEEAEGERARRRALERPDSAERIADERRRLSAGAPGGAGSNFDVVGTLQMLARDGVPTQTGVSLVQANWENMTPEQRRSVRQYIAQLPPAERAAWNAADLTDDIDDPRTALNQRARSGSQWIGKWYPGGETQAGVLIAMERLRQGQERYQDIGLAVVHAVDPQLASRVAATGGDPEKLAFEDEMKLRNVINRTNGAVPEGWLDLVEGSPLSVFNSLAANRPGAGGAGRMRRVLDPVQVKTQFADLFNALLLMEPSEELQGQLAAELQAQLDSAEEGMNFDASSRILDFVRGTARYKELYGNKPGGQTEEEYLGQFLGAGQSMLGAENAPTGALEAGLRTGQYQTTIGAIAGSDQAWRNSRFLGRLAEVAKVVSSQT